MSSAFSASPAVGPPKPWEDPMSYPAIMGITRIQNVRFSNFGKGCGENGNNYVWMTNPLYGDIIHPTELKAIQLDNVMDVNKVRTGQINHLTVL